MTTRCTEIEYKWLEDDDNFDFIVGVALNGKPICTGFWVDYMTVLTSYNPFHSLSKDELKDITVHTIDGNYKVSKVHKVNMHIKPLWETNQVWMENKDGKHTPNNDIYSLRVSYGENQESRQPIAVPKQYVKKRHPLTLTSNNSWFVPGLKAEILFAGFGFVNKTDIENNTQLQVYRAPITDLLDCDEWVSREWGCFVCIANKEGLAGVPLGGPLFLNDVVQGIGGFTLEKNNESILVFTFIPYLEPIHFPIYVKPGDPVIPWET